MAHEIQFGGRKGRPTFILKMELFEVMWGGVYPRQKKLSWMVSYGGRKGRPTRFGRKNPRFFDAIHAQGEAVAVDEGFHFSGDGDNGVLGCDRAPAAVSVGKQFRFHHAGPVSEGEELHQSTVGLPMGPFRHDQAAGADPSVRMLFQFRQGNSNNNQT